MGLPLGSQKEIFNTKYSRSKLLRSELLQKDKSVSFHTRNLQYLATEIFKFKIGISPTIVMTEIFKFCDNATYTLRNDQVLELRQ